MHKCRTQDDIFSITNIRKCREYVSAMQKRLDKAVANNDKGKIRSIFNILTKRSFAVRILAVWKITYENTGKKTAGIDGINIPKGKSREKTDKIRYELLNAINIGQEPKPIKRVYIPKGNGKKRPLGMPTLQDRIHQEILRIALDPIVEYHSHDNSFGFRAKRSCHDAIQAIFSHLSASNRKRYILEGDIKGCFDHISHQHIANTLRYWKVPKYAVKIISTMLKSGIIHNGTLTESKEGTPQGGVISPLLSNVALTTFDWHISELFGTRTYHGGKHNISPMIRYADDFVIICNSKTEAVKMKEWIKHFLSYSIGLTLSNEKTKITHIKKGFNFIGFNIKKYPTKKNPKDISDYKLLIKPQKEKVLNLLRKVKETLDKNKQSTQETVIRKLNPIIRGWGNYNRHVVSSKIFSTIDYQIWVKLLRWGKRRHPNKSKRWIIRNYFNKKISVRNTNHNKSWYFNTPEISLIRLTDFPIRRHIKVKRLKRIYNLEDIPYWNKREDELMRMRLYLKGKDLYQKQKGKCPYCKHPFAFEDNLHIHHILPKAQGGKDSYSNLQLLHTECHREIHSKTGTYG